MGSLRTRKLLSLRPVKTTRVGAAAAEEPVDTYDEEPLSPKARLFHAPGLNCCVITILGSKTKLNVDALKDSHRNGATLHPRYTRALVG